ncbi:putative cyclase [Polyporus arcularius HHB13444]|uniref:Putative cyclase n=1 Tax=Polyporus arcularius HHB13444 TaxID=1314778 RepID=A0A5C3NWA6_9APHY|nr:putative cyclase [Polyporus arcularius HHB13444]
MPPATVIDLTHPLIPGKVPAWPGHPCYNASLNSSLANGEFANVHALTIGTHTGTHLDAPYHFFMDGTTVDRLDLTLLTAAPAVVADVRHRGAHERIAWEDLSAAAEEVRRRKARVLLLCTGWSRQWTQPDYSDHPWLDADAARRIMELDVRVIGVDTMSPDEVAPGKDCAHVHRVVLGSGGIIVENLKGLDELVDSGWKNVTVSLLPLRLDGCDGSPLRAVAWDGTL